MRSFVVESYVPAGDASAFEALVRRVRAVESAQPIRHLGSLVLLEDEVCLHLFAAPSAAALLAATEEAGFPSERVVPTIWRPGEGA